MSTSSNVQAQTQGHNDHKESGKHDTNRNEVKHKELMLKTEIYELSNK